MASAAPAATTLAPTRRPASTGFLGPPRGSFPTGDLCGAQTRITALASGQFSCVNAYQFGHFCAFLRHCMHASCADARKMGSDRAKLGISFGGGRWRGR